MKRLLGMDQALARIPVPVDRLAPRTLSCAVAHTEETTAWVRSSRCSLLVARRSSLVALASFVLVGFAPLTAQIGWNPDGWEGPYNWSPNLPNGWEIAHAALIGKPGPHQGKVLVFRTHATTETVWLWDPAAPHTLELANAGHHLDNQFCAGHTWDKDGDLILAGGDRNSQCDQTEPNWSYVFFPDSLLWQQTPELLHLPNPGQDVGHYYPSVIALPDGRAFLAGGGTAPWNSAACGPYRTGQLEPVFYRADEHQVFDKASWTWIGMPSGDAVLGLGKTPPLLGFHFYPLLHLLSNGYVFCSVATWGAYNGTVNRDYCPSAFVNVSAGAPSTWTWQAHPSTLQDSSSQLVNLVYPTAFLWPWTVGQSPSTDRVVVIGGWDSNLWYRKAPPSRVAENTAWEMTDPSNTQSTWTRPAGWSTLSKRRLFANATILPDMSVVVFGGSENQFAPFAKATGNPPEVAPQPVYEPERLDLLNAQAGWQLLEPHDSPRLYHTVAVLLPDGRVLLAGGYKTTLPPNALIHTDAEIFLPDYLRWAVARPQLVNPPAVLNYGAAIPTLTIALAGAQNPATEIEFATLIRCASVTHHFDWDQKVVRLPVQAASGNQLTLQPLPAIAQGGRNIAPPGYYMLFVVTKNTWGGVNTRFPSVAAFVQVM